MSDISKNKFLGRWKLASCTGKNGARSISPLGEAPFGMLIYTEQYMMVFISSNERKKFSTNDIRAIPPEQIVLDFSNFETYCGSYCIDFMRNKVTHYIESGKNPNQIGTQFCRYFSFERKKLILKSTDSLLLNGEPWLVELIWNKQE
ncbi:lipocalin-like domain-containing protein [Sodalis sp. RH16]|uniref:lipocalin-like domain-containing protein n=1 Tax=unclassified Sodalis (in: enterobacteria) TaxID=2636512 RepID=UPI0039B442D7